jgi:hypothetical protein
MADRYYTIDADPHVEEPEEARGSLMMTSADIPHVETRASSLRDIAQRENLTDTQKRKILSENATRFYQL